MPSVLLCQYSRQLLPADRRHQLRTVSLHEMRVAAVRIGAEDDAVGRWSNREIGHVDRHGLRQVDFLLDLRIAAFRNEAAEQPARETLVILDANAAIADPQLVLGEVRL